MADPLRHSCKLDIAEEILDFIATNPDAEKIRLEIGSLLNLSEEDIEDAAGVVADIGNLINGQKF